MERGAAAPRRGRLTQHTQSLGSLSQSLVYTYTDGRLTGLTLPSGRSLAYSRDPAGRIAGITLADTPLVQAIAYAPHGHLKEWTDPAGRPQTRAYDLDGQVTHYSAGGQTWSLAYDNAGRLTGIADTANAAMVVGYGYDALDRLTSAGLPYTSYGYSYDANGNRTARTLGGTTQAITLASTSNRTLSLASSPPVSYSYDAAGNRTGDGIASYTYDARGRLSTATTTAGTTRYQSNARHQRIRKTGPDGDTIYVYDLQGHLVSEADGSGTITREYVWLDDTPVAILDGPPDSTSIYAIHPDHLNTPRAVTNASGTVVWRNSPVSEPFGLTPPEEDPDGDGTRFVMNLRFPGQYFDRETNLAYNWHRFYDAQGGAYAQSDPIGLAGGQWSTYGYVDGNPIKYADPMGLEKTLRDMLGPDSMDTPPPPDYPTTDRRPAPPPPPPPPSVPNPDPWPGPDDPKGQCIRLYDKCINQGWKGNCDACVKKCIAQEEWPFRGPVSCRPKNNQCPAL